MLLLKEEYWQNISKELFNLMKEVYYKPIFELFEEPFYNSSNVVLDAIRSGKIILKDGVISGTFNINISKELSKFSDFDGRSKTFKIKDKSNIPNDIFTAAMTANEKSKKLHEEIKRRLQYMDKSAKERFKNLKFSIDKTADQIESVLKQEWKQLGIIPNIQPKIKDKLIKEYNKNMELSIVDENNPGQDWNSEQVERLRSMIEKSSTEGHNKKNLIAMIENEFDITRNKAKFLARQETSLFMSNLRNERYIDSGIKYYIWSNSHDIRVVGNPSGLYPNPTIGHGNHWFLGGKICRFDDSTLYADSKEEAKKGIWKSKTAIGAGDKHPGEEFLCRCGAIAIIL